MIRWIQQSKWLPEILLAAVVFLLLGGIDLLLQGSFAMLASLSVAASLIFSRRLSVLSGILLAGSAAIQIGFGLFPTVGSVGIGLAAFIVGAFSPKPWREINLIAAVFSGMAIAANFALNPALELTGLGVVRLSDAGRLGFFVVFSLLAISFISLLWILGLLLITRLIHVGTDFDRQIYEQKQLELSVELAEQSRRFEIARDINEQLVKDISSVVSNAEGGIYASRSEPQAGVRALERVLESAKSAQRELRRLFDMISRGRQAASAPPSLADLDQLALRMRDAGLDVSVVQFGTKFEVDPTAQLSIYRIVFDALQNSKKHNPSGTRATVELSWMDAGLQLLVKDNGVEVARKGGLAESGVAAGYTADEDLDTLLERISGPGITAMKERAASHGGSLEVQRVVGIGFTLSANFPKAAIALSDN